MKLILSVITALLAMMITSVCLAAPAFTNLSTASVGTNTATLVMQSDVAVTSYFTLLNGSNANCGTSAQIKAGLDGSDNPAYRKGSLQLTENIDGYYTVRNLTQSTNYTACFTADPAPEPAVTAINLATTAARPFTELAWHDVGDAGFSASIAYFTSLAFAPDGTPYLAYQDWGNDGKATVMKLSGTTWNEVGIAGLSSSQADYTSLAFAPDGTPYLAYQDWGNEGKATVMKFSGTAWNEVGVAGFSAGTASFISLAFAPDGSPYMGYQDGNKAGKATVMKYSGTSWSEVGIAGFSANQADYTSLAIAPDGTPHLAYVDYGNFGTTVMKFDGSNWINVGIPGFSASDAMYLSHAFAPGGSPYLAYQDGDKANKATVMKYGSGSWSAEGAAGFSSGQSNYTSLAFAPDGTPCVAYFDAGSGGKATVMQYSGETWSSVGSAGFSAGAANYTSLAFAPDGTPYVAYGDDGNGSRATVMKLANPLELTGNPDAFATVDVLYSFTPTVEPPGTSIDSYSLSGELPPGLSFNIDTGTLSGIPDISGNGITYDNIVITATNSLGSASLPAFSITVVNTPDTTITSQLPANPATAAGFSFSFTATVSGSTFECSLNGGSYAACSSPYSGSIFQFSNCRIETTMGFSVKASAGGKTDESPASHLWTINQTLGELLTNVNNGGVVQLRTTTDDHTGDLNINRPGIAFSLKGGYNSDYTSNSGLSNIHGAFTISGGTVTFDNIVIM